MTQEELQKLLTSFEKEVGHITEAKIDQINGAKIGAAIRAKKVVDEKLGFHGATKEQRSEWAKLYGHLGGNIQGKKNVESGHWDRIVTAETRRKGTQSQIDNKIGIFGFNDEEVKERAIKGGYGMMNKYTLEERQARGFNVGKPKKPILQCDLDGNLIKEWDSPTAAAIGIGTNRQYIYNVCRGVRGSHKGFIWKYKN